MSKDSENTVREVSIRVAPEDAQNPERWREAAASLLGLSPSNLSGVRLLRRSLDARGRIPLYELKLQVAIGSARLESDNWRLKLCNVRSAEPAIIVGAGPAGLFAALRLVELGIRPVVFERGKPVRERRFDLAAITKRGEVDPDSNYCFGEGGAGTFSDGKLYTRSTKRGSVERILRIFVAHGANPEILVDAHPHIGTNKLPAVVTAIRQAIEDCGGEFHFSSAVDELLVDSGAVQGIRLRDGTRHASRAVILATGHSARDVFAMLARQNILIERKSFALGVRVEHPQAFVDTFQYRMSPRASCLPPASYSLVAQCGGRGVFSFCMCPGGIICPAATANDEVVVNGWSPSTRNSRFANSGIVVEVRDEDLAPFGAAGELAGVAFQTSVEQRAAVVGGGHQAAPAQRLTDVIAGKLSASLPVCSYLPGLQSALLHDVLPPAIFERLTAGFKAFEKKRRGYISSEAVAVAVESRTSSPVRIPRDPVTRFHPELRGLAPAGEGAGYAGGIVSAAMDGESAAEAVEIFFAENRR